MLPLFGPFFAKSVWAMMQYVVSLYSQQFTSEVNGCTFPLARRHIVLHNDTNYQQYMHRLTHHPGF